MPFDLPDGRRVYPVVEIPPTLADDQVVTGWELVMAGDRVERIAVVATITAPPPPTLVEVKAAKYQEITRLCDEALSPLAAEYGVMERTTWDQQAAEARALQADASADAPLVRAMAAARDMDVTALAARILGHEARWKALAGAVIGQRQRIWDQVDAVTDQTPDAVAVVQAVVVIYTLPEA